MFTGVDREYLLIAGLATHELLHIIAFGMLSVSF